jgi:hypothetical protein
MIRIMAVVLVHVLREMFVDNAKVKVKEWDIRKVLYLKFEDIF